MPGAADVSLAAKLANIPIWAFHSRDETFVPRAGTEQMVAAMKNAGGNVYLTLIPSTSHDCWTAAFQEHNILAWLFCSAPWGLGMLDAARHLSLEMATYPDRAVCVLHNCGAGHGSSNANGDCARSDVLPPPGIRKQPRAS